MRTLTRLALAGGTAIVAAALLVLVGLGGEGDERRAVSSSPWHPPPACPVTVPNGSTPPGESPSPDTHGNGKLWAAVSRTGVFLVAPRSAPEYPGPSGEIAV